MGGFDRAALWAWRVLGCFALAGGVVLLPVMALIRPRWLRGLGERLGGGPFPARPPVWIHAASVGEVRLALALARGIEARGAEVCLSTSTVAGRDLARRELPGRACFLGPLDHLLTVRRAFERIRPRALVLVETELWPELLRGARARGVRVTLVNGRISDRSFGRYRALRGVLGPLLAGIGAVLPRSVEDSGRLVMLGCRPEACLPPGDLKSASLPSQAGRPLRSEPPLVLVSGSVHEREFGRWLELLRRTEDLPLRHVVAPRHLEALGELRRLLGEAGRGYELWTALRPNFPDPPPRLVVVDTVGDLQALWAEGDLAFVGGTLDAGAGGHNLLEPAALGRPVLFGPGVADHRRSAELLLETGGGLQAGCVEALAFEVARLTGHPGSLRDMAERASKTAAAEREEGVLAMQGAVKAILDPLEAA